MSGSSHAEEKKLSKEEEEVQLFKVTSFLKLMVIKFVNSQLASTMKNLN